MISSTRPIEGPKPAWLPSVLLGLVCAAGLLAWLLAWNPAFGESLHGTQNGGQTEPPPVADAEQAKLQKMLAAARFGKPVVRPQAAAQLVSLGAPAAEAILGLAGADNQSFAELGAELIGELGRLKEPRLRVKLWEASADADFPWRPAVLRSLLVEASASEAAQFERCTQDPLSAVRASALEGLQLCAAEGSLALARELLEDPEGLVRRRAALILARGGEPLGLVYLWEELQRGDRFFDNDTGGVARREAAKWLSECLGDVNGFLVAEHPDTPANRAALAALRERIAQRLPDGWPKLPDLARASLETIDGLIGLELRSCRRGEIYLAWTEDDRLLVGTGNPALVRLPEGSVAKLLGGCMDLPERLGDDVFGKPGCDLERYRLRLESGSEPWTVHVLKSQEAVPDLRPRALTELAEALLETLPEEGEDVRLKGLRSRTQAALQAIGG